jgi:hypothetical protein
MKDTLGVILDNVDIAHAVARAQETYEKWARAPGHYNNTFKSHLTGKLGEFAVEKVVQQWRIRYTPHFKASMDDGLCDIGLLKPNTDAMCRVEVKTWSDEHWEALGRCVAIRQVPSLEKKADRIIWCIVGNLEKPLPDAVLSRASMTVTIVGWSTLEDVKRAPVRYTGHAWMRKVENHQLDEEALRPIDTFLQCM